MLSLLREEANLRSRVEENAEQLKNLMQSFGDHCCLVKAQMDAADAKKLRVEVDGHAKTATIARFEQVSEWMIFD